MSSCRVRDSSKSVPAIPACETVCDRWFVSRERVTVFDDSLHERLKPVRGHIVKGQLDGQGVLW